jgi:PleD family two-component response regulator
VDGRTVEELLQAADVALYRAKAAGKNRYLLSDE